ncbi:MAG TPA: alpha/beta hydrolase fold domain-containing protein [Enterovirga sp.]|nr:alpha/beta hydrolase fold domain-containing protein [Enterovirga sp.]
MSIARLALHLALSLVLSGSAAFAATPPAQPKSGPGGAENAGAEVVKRAVGTQSAYSYVYYTAGKPAAPRPVVVFLHGWGATNPMIYGGWIDHLARRGYLVLFPGFHEVGRTRPVDATARAAARVKAALAALQSDPDARPDTTRVAILGHSAGAGVAANLAAIAKSSDLPVPKLVFLMMPGGIASDEKSRGIQLADLSQIDPGTDMIAMVGDREAAASERVSRRILRAASEVPPSRKLFMRAGSDDHGFPTLSATLAAPGAPLDGYDTAAIKLPPDPPRDPKAPREAVPRWSADMVLSGEQQVLLNQLNRNVIDTLDWLAFWRTFDIAADAAFASGELAPLLRTEPALLDMGRWSDGWPVRRLAAETPRAESAAPVTRVAPAPSKMPVIRKKQPARQR